MNKRSKQVGIRDVARAAGVSRTTVSHALSGRRHVSAETRARVLSVAGDLGYRANALAQGLAVRWNGIISLHVSPADGPPLAVSDIEYFAELVNAAALHAFDLGYWLAVAPPEMDHAVKDRIRPDGAIIVDPRVGDSLVARLRAQSVPVVTTGRDPDHNDAVWIGSNHLQNTRTVLDHLRAQGARRIALLTGPFTASYTIDTYTAYMEWTRARGSAPEVVVAGGGTASEPGLEETLVLLSAAEPPDAIYATLDRLALSALAAAHVRGVRVPDQLMIAALADGHVLRHAEPPITALHLNPTLVGAKAVAAIIALIEGRRPTRRGCIVPTTLRARVSTGARSEARKCDVLRPKIYPPPSHLG